MIFNSLRFLVFFAGFFSLYWFVFSRNLKYQNLLILLGSYIFYAKADYRFLSLLICVSAINFWLGISIARSTIYKKTLLYVGMIFGIGTLLFFKYFNFFISSFNDLFKTLDMNINIQLLNIIIPLGISFFTFRTMGYLQDVDKGKIKPTTNWIHFFTYVAFFPCLLSGPIDKAKTFIPQLERKRVFNYSLAADGMRQILWGLFKKMVVADNCSIITNEIFSNYKTLPGSSLLLGALFYTVQIYADFSGYSDMAIGVSKLLGIQVTRNFEYPYFSQNIAEYWRKWHMSLTAWLTEYVFTPLSVSFRDWGKTGLGVAIIFNFTIVGIWHGANWTYVLFGFLNGCYFIPLIIKGTLNKKKKIVKGRLLPSLPETINIIKTFTLVMLTFVIFRSENISQAFHYYTHLFSWSLFSIPVISNNHIAVISVIFWLIMFIIEWFRRDKEHGLQIDDIKRPAMRAFIYCSLIVCILLFSATDANQFIYFKF
jgi:alginate O-acetyltransferase complex protein AlgI